MCGIVGIINFNQVPVEKKQIQTMINSIQHRGPDGEGIYLDNFIGLGHRRLAIIDLTSSGHQPMLSQENRYSIVYNGEIYNYVEIRTQLKQLGYHFQSNSDTEVILYAFMEWGKNCLNQFNGMFAFAIWDQFEKTLFLARDRYGIKPLYYVYTNNRFIFSSESKAILSLNDEKYDLDKEGLVEYLTFQNFFSDRTLHKNIKIFNPGHFMYLRLDGISDYREYWDFSFDSDFTLSESEAKEELDFLFKQAVKRQLVSDVPINAYLSGGVDSSAITIVSSKLIPDMKTFTIGFDLSSVSGLELGFDERKNAEHVSFLARTEHYEMVLKAGDMERCMPRYIFHLEEPRVGQSYPNYYASKLASRFGKVVLSGAGGDELFGGYPWRYFNSSSDVSFEHFIRSYYLKWQRLFDKTKLQNLLYPIWGEVSHVDTEEIFRGVFRKIKKETLSPEDCFNFSLYLEAKTFLHSLLVVDDKLSMAFGLETRVPFLDNDLVDFAMKIPSYLKVKNKILKTDENDIRMKKQDHKIGKYLLRKTLSNYLDDFIINNPKQGFSSPDASWFKGESIDFVSRNLEDLNPIFNYAVVKDILREHTENIKNNRLAIWSLIYLNCFFKKMNNAL